jgi:hypothetical protein
MPRDEDVTIRAGSVRAMTGVTEQEFQALLRPFEHAFVAYLQTIPLMGSLARSAATGHTTRVPYPRSPTNGFLC